MSESEEDNLPTEFKSHSHYVASLIDKAQLKVEKDGETASHEYINNDTGLNNKTSNSQKDKEVDESIVLKDIENNQSSPESESLPQSKSNAIVSSDESSESSEEETREQVQRKKTNQIARVVESDSESSSSSSSESASENDSPKEVEENNAPEGTHPLKDDMKNPQGTEATNARSESDETENDLEMVAESSKIQKHKISKKTSKRKYSSLSEIASNASNRSSSSKAESQQKQSSSSSLSSSSLSSESESNEKTGKRVKRSSLRSLAKDGIFD